MKAERSRAATGLRRAALASLLASLLASCTAAGDAQFGMQPPGFTAGDAAARDAVDAEAGDAAAAAKPAADQTDFTEAGNATEEEAAPVAAEAKPAPAPAPPSVASAGSRDIAPPVAEEPAPASGPATIAAATPADLVDKKKRSFLSSFFASPAATPTAAVKPLIPDAAVASEKAPGAPGEKPKPLIKLASAESNELRTANASIAFGGDENALPGVRQTMLFEIKRKSGIDDDSDVDIHEEDDLGPIQVASAAGMARLAPNGLLKQNETVDTACLKPALVRTLKLAEQHFGKRAVITSGFRDPERNRRARGAKNSMHMYCAAADVQLPGISKWELATYFRAMPGRGGVGTYCHTESVHVDIGPERDWNWRCRRRG